jgi:hypothetical protein
LLLFSIPVKTNQAQMTKGRQAGAESNSVPAALAAARAASSAALSEKGANAGKRTVEISTTLPM